MSIEELNRLQCLSQVAPIVIINVYFCGKKYENHKSIKLRNNEICIILAKVKCNYSLSPDYKRNYRTFICICSYVATYSIAQITKVITLNIKHYFVSLQ